MRKEQIAKLANKLWTDEGFKREFMKGLRGGATGVETIEFQEQVVSQAPIGSISVSKCGVGAGCTNHTSHCGSTTM